MGLWRTAYYSLATVVLLGGAPVFAQTVTPFQFVGHIQNFALDPATGGPADLLRGGRLKVNGIDVVLPANLVILMPAAYKTPVEIFQEAPGVSKDNGESGLALADQVPPLAAFEAAVDGNIVCAPPAPCRYIAGQVHISQQSLNSGSGFIKAINLATGELRIGASATDPVSVADARVRLNDPVVKIPDPSNPANEIDLIVAGQPSGRFGLANPLPFAASPDPDSRFPDARFQVDQDNPTVHALTGFPMCVPRAASDPECPTSNRPLDSNGAPLNTFVMGGPDLPNPSPGVSLIRSCGPVCDPTKQAPLLVGDYATYQGTQASRPDPANPGQHISFISAHTLEANVGIYTQAGVDPAYVNVDPILIGTRGDQTVCGPSGAGECQDRIKVEGFTTDPTRPVNIYALDVKPAGTDYTETLRFIGPGATKPAPFGRFRFVTGSNSGVLFDNTGTLQGATRELVVRIEAGAGVPVGGSKAFNDLPTVANGLMAGQYVAPIGEYIYPEPHVLGIAPPMLNFQCLSFLARGWKSGTTIYPRLNPWPGFNDAPGDPRFFSCSD